MFILVVGNPIEGFKHDGIFFSSQDAVAYGELKYPSTEWWVASLTMKTEGLTLKHGEHIPALQVLADLLYGLMQSINHNDGAASRLNAISIANHATLLYNELSLTPAEPTTVIRVIEDTCSCSHNWDQHTQNVYGVYVCSQCTCRGMQPPKGFASEFPNQLGDDF